MSGRTLGHELDKKKIENQEDNKRIEDRWIKFQNSVSSFSRLSIKILRRLKIETDRTDGPNYTVKNYDITISRQFEKLLCLF